MSELLAKIMAGAQNHKIIKWPGQENLVKIRVATENDQSIATLEADKKFKDRSIGIANAQAYLDYKMSWLLYLVVSNPDDDKPLGQFIAFEKMLTPGVKEALDNEQDELQIECSPSPDKMTETELQAWFEEAKKNTEQAIFHIGNMSTAKQAITYTVSRLLESQQDS